MKDIPQLATEIKQIIEDSLCKSYRMSPGDKAARVYADVEVRFRRIELLRHRLINKTIREASL